MSSSHETNPPTSLLVYPLDGCASSIPQIWSKTYHNHPFMNKKKSDVNNIKYYCIYNEICVLAWKISYLLIYKNHQHINIQNNAKITNLLIRFFNICHWGWVIYFLGWSLLQLYQIANLFFFPCPWKINIKKKFKWQSWVYLLKAISLY